MVKYDDYYIDLTRNQFADYNNRVLIEDKYGSIATLLRDVKKTSFLPLKRKIFASITRLIVGINFTVM